MVHALAYVIALWCAPGLESIKKKLRNVKFVRRKGEKAS